MRTYMESLDRLAEVPMRVLCPAHGPVAPDGNKLVRQFIKHRRQRQAALATALQDGPNTIEGLLPTVYWDVKEDMYQYAARSMLAGLQMLEEEGRAACAAFPRAVSRRRSSPRWPLQTCRCVGSPMIAALSFGSAGRSTSRPSPPVSSSQVAARTRRRWNA